MNLDRPLAGISLVGLLTLLVCSAQLSTPLYSQEEKSQEEKSQEEKDDDDTMPEVLAGHSAHGEIFNEGLRQRAYLIPGMANIEFPATTTIPEAHKFFVQGVAQVHGFWYLEAERSFRQAAALDPDFAMAYWGMALANRSNSTRGKGFIAEADARKEGVTKREQMYIAALHAYFEADPKNRKERAQKYITAMEELIHEYPDDLEAKAMLALQLYNSRSAGIPIASHVAVDAIIQQVLAKNPMHPVHHYRIHLWDYKRAQVALTSANMCGQASPGIAHMWHMPGHIYSRLKRYDDASWQQEASARVDHAHMMRDRVLPDQIHNFAHNNEWLIRNLIHIGRVGDAVDLARNMTELPRHPRYNTLSRSGSSKYGRDRLFTTLVTFELWDELVRLADTPYLEPTEIDTEQVKRLRQLGFALAQLDRSAEAEQTIEQLDGRVAGLKEAADKASAEAEQKARDDKKDDKEVAKAGKDARRTIDGKVRGVEQAVAYIRAAQLSAAEDHAAAFEQLKKAGSVDKMMYCRFQLAAGETAAALEAADKHVKGRGNQVQPLACQVALLWQADKEKQAERALTELIKISGSIDMQSAVFTRINPIAEKLGIAEPWKAEPTLRDDIGERPELDSLGPFRWQPSAAPDWRLADQNGKKFSLKQYRGKPVLVIFYLGYSCLHCAEQIQAFAPRNEEFAAQGISLIAISTDDRDGLKQSIDNYDEETIPFPLVSDDKLEVFKDYRVHDDFEQVPLHGTFLIGGDGMVLWQDISYEPFMNVDFVLKESQRLLGQRAVLQLTRTSK
jgi:peroxiredoxin